MDLARQAIETLRNARFPVYAVPPSDWTGDVMVRGVWGDRKHALAITMSYDDDLAVETPDRQIEIISTGAEGMTKRSPPHTFLLHEASYETELANFVENIGRGRLRQGPHGMLQAGQRRPLEAVAFDKGLWVERASFDEHRELRIFRVQTPRAEVLVLGWNWDDDALVTFTQRARPIQHDQALCAQIEAAEYAAWKKIEGRHS
ncbi:MAG: hypothetical protein M3N53_13150 [Actinomycetota bacterium]|nr:hypothetical protein [Actinomycetota bacterium]